MLLLLVCLDGFSQETDYEFRTVVKTGTTIGRQTFGAATKIYGLALADNGEIAFLARWPEGSLTRTAIFTSTCMVVSQDDSVNGAHLFHIQEDSLTVNASGQVAYAALYLDS